MLMLMLILMMMMVVVMVVIDATRTPNFGLNELGMGVGVQGNDAALVQPSLAGWWVGPWVMVLGLGLGAGSRG